MEKMNSTGTFSFVDMLMRHSVGMMTSRMARSEEMLKTAWMISKRKYVAHSSCGGGSVQYPEKGRQLRNRVSWTATKPAKVYAAHTLTQNCRFRFVLE